MATWQTISGSSNPIPIKEFTGLFKPFDDGYSLNPSYATDIANITSDAYPALATRPDFPLLGTALSGRIRGLGQWKELELSAIAGGTWSKWNGSSWQTVVSGLNANADWSFVNFKGNLTEINLIAANGTDPVKRYDGSTVQNLANAKPNSNYITSHANRLFAAVENRVYYSALNKADDWDTVDDAGDFGIDTRNGETINALTSGLEFLTIFKPSSIHQLYGTGPDTYKLEDIAFDIGIINNRCHVTVDGVLYFMDKNGIYRFTGGVRPTRNFSQPVQQLINGINKSALDKCFAGSDGQNAYFGIPYGSSNEVSHIIRYDVVKGIWSVYEGIQGTCMILMGETPYIGTVNGSVLQRGTTSTGVSARWVSVPFTASTSASNQDLYDIWYKAYIPSGSTLQLYVSTRSSGDSDWTLVGSVAGDGSIKDGRIHLPYNRVANTKVYRIKWQWTGAVVLFEWDRRGREYPWR